MFVFVHLEIRKLLLWSQTVTVESNCYCGVKCFLKEIKQKIIEFTNTNKSSGL
jgi:hypothetical protein